jgi:putative transposase
MPRTARVVVPGYPHHLILRGNNRRNLFSYPRDYRGFLFDIAGARSRYACLVHAFCLMTNHVHLLVTPLVAGTLNKFVQRIAQCLAQRRNRTRGGSGKLFEERFKSVLVVDDAQLAATTAYVELNPTRAGLCSRPEEYAWSSYRLHAGTERSRVLLAMWAPSPWYLSLGRADATRAKAYVEWFDGFRALPEEDQRSATALPDPAPVRGSNRVLRPDGSSAR